ncbi:right-handed parallel beta-helix repeat-containing protein [Cellulophaga baltica]|uniref:right-handed parallel beta-helix repeat-containing protein n=1 Tax=Cellulophaga TaxID=104264 RepID=UPI001C076331|nr:MULTISPECIES: right-handed parallel beta-helix repeat-containing protein [Cellulophaga]MBU2996747.1 right-handed parallel beta-helix repeat-containing protein [Cellulophaga baltica]MDO6768143.1 right-handed parallel beta-helix repeat-containing protein [Cellulophaga sp. 1_MG-2023]
MIKINYNKNIWVFLLILLNITTLCATEIDASRYGFNSSDNSEVIISALQSSYDTIIIDKQSTDWIVSPIRVNYVSNKVIIFESGVVLKAKSGYYNSSNAQLFQLVSPENVEIIGYGATFKMDRDEYQSYDPDGQWRNSLNITNGTNISVKGLTIDESGGDGVYIGDTNGDTNGITLEDLTITNQSRDGISIIGGTNITIDNCSISGTKSNILGCGINFEPNNSSNKLKNIVIENSIFYDNYYYGIQISTWNLSSSSEDISITFNDCTLSNNSYNNSKSAGEIKLSVGTSSLNPVDGNITFNNLVVENSTQKVLNSRIPSDAFMTTFNDCTFRDVCSEVDEPPFLLQTTDYYAVAPSFGNTAFNNTELSYDNSEPFIKFSGAYSTEGLENISGDFTIANDNLKNDDAIYYGKINKFINVSLSYKIVSELPIDEDDEDENNDKCTDEINIVSDEDSATSVYSLTLTEASNTVDHTSGIVKYASEGKVILEPGFSVKATSNEVFIATIEDCEGGSLNSTALTYDINNLIGYTLWSPENETINNDYVNSLYLSKNPTYDFSTLYFELEHKSAFKLYVYNTNGTLIKTTNVDLYNANNGNIELDFQYLDSGVYIINAVGTNINESVKFIKM